MSKIELVESLSRAIDGASIDLMIARRYNDGRQPMSFLSPDAKRQLGDRLSHLGANYCKLATDAVAERLSVTGFTRSGKSLTRVWDAWLGAGMASGLADALHESLSVGQSFLTVWTDEKGKPSVSVESPQEMAVTRDPLSREITAALKRWRDADGYARAVLYQSDAVTTYRGIEVPQGGIMPSTGYNVASTVPNPLGVVPVVDLTNSDGMFDDSGTPESAQIWTLVDALNKILSDSMVASESTALPRRWATGIALDFDDEGNLIPPFSVQPGNVWLAESKDSKLGQFPEASLASYGAHIEMLIRQIGSISGLPDHLVGIAGNDPSSAEQIRASESSLITKAYRKQVLFAKGIARAAALIEAILNNGPVKNDILVSWKSPENRTRAAEADAVSKLVQAGILPLEWAWKELGYTPSEIADMRRMNLRQSVEVSSV